MQRSSDQPRLPPPFQGLKVLLVTTDDAIQSCIKNQLLLPHYQITILHSCTVALQLLKYDNFDLVLSDFSSLKDMNGYHFIAQVQVERKNIRHVVIFEAERLSHDEIIRAYQSGACYILWKPLSEPFDEIKNLWQHPFRCWVQNEGSSSQLVSSQQESLKRGNNFINHDEGSLSQLVSSQQKSLERGNNFINDDEEPSLKKRQRFTWTDELHARFVEVVKQLQQLGEYKVIPTNILRYMKEPGLTREIVGSHLQKHRDNERNKRRGRELRERRRVNNVKGRNQFGITNHMAPPVVSSSSYQHLPLLETSTTNYPPPPRPLLETSTTNYPPPPPRPQRRRQRQIQHQHLACQPTQFNNFGAVTSFIGNGVNNVMTYEQPDRKLVLPFHVNTTRPPGPFHVNTTRPPGHQPDQIIGASFESKESNMLQQSHTDLNLLQQSHTDLNLLQHSYTDPNLSGLQQSHTDPNLTSCCMLQQSHTAPNLTSCCMLQQSHTAPNLTSSMEQLQLDHDLTSCMLQQSHTNLTSSMEQLKLDQDPVSGIINQDQALGTPIDQNLGTPIDQNCYLGTSFEKGNMEQQPITHLTSSTQQLDQNPGTQQLDRNTSSISGIINQDQSLGTPFGRNDMEQLNQNHFPSTYFEESNVEQQMINQNPGTQQLDPYSDYGIINQDTFYSPGHHDGMITPEVTDAEYWASLLNFDQEFDVQPSDGLNNFQDRQGFLYAHQEMDAHQEIDAHVQQMNEKEPSHAHQKTDAHVQEMNEKEPSHAHQEIDAHVQEMNEKEPSQIREK